MTDRIILTTVSIIMLILTIQKKEKYSIILTCGLTLGILITWTKIPIMISAGMLIYMIAALLITFYGIRLKQLSILEKTVISVTGMWAFVTILFQLNHYPYANVLRLSLIFPLLLYLILLRKGLIRKNEFGFLTILNLGFLLSLINN
jgi:hypothetical protein